METDVLVSLKDAAQQLGVSVDFLKKRIRAGVVQPIRMGRLVKLSQLDLDAWKRTGLQKLQEEVNG